MIGEWLDIGPVSQISPGNARTLPVRRGQEIAEFHTLDNGFYALINSCPHKQGPLSQGTVHGNIVTCPLHNWNISLKTGEALGVDKGCVPVTLLARGSTSRLPGPTRSTRSSTCILPRQGSASPALRPLDHRPAQPDGRARGRRTGFEPCRAHGLRTRERRARRPVLGRAEDGCQTGAQGGRPVP